MSLIFEKEDHIDYGYLPPIDYNKNILTLTKEQRKLIDDFIFKEHPYTFTKEQYWYSYQQWGKGSERIWNVMQQGGTGIMYILCWYHHIHSPKSKEYRPSIIIKQLINYLETRNNNGTI